MEGIDKITGRIDADVQREIDEITAAAQATAAEISAGYQARAKSEADAILEKGKVSARQREERLESVAQLEARKLTLTVKQEMVEEAFRRALEKLTALPDKEYIDLLAKLAAAASRTGREQVILSQKDRTRFGKQIVSQANDILAKEVAPKLPGDFTETRTGAFLNKVATVASAVIAGTGMLTMAEDSRSIAGGLILRDDKVETNCSFEVLIHLQRDTLANQVAKVLF